MTDPHFGDDLALAAEFATQHHLAVRGDPYAARRVAELYEFADQLGPAKEWWRRAAELGDPDAVLYVQSIIAG